MNDTFTLVLILFAWLALQLWVLPRLGAPT